jgi:hypothetical protein
MAIPFSITRQLRGRYGLSENDTSLDDEINKLSPVEMVQETVAWELGDASWANRIAGFMRATGAKPEDF